MAIQEGVENKPGPLDSRLLSTNGKERLDYGLEVFRGLVGSERFGTVLTALGFNLLQAPFVAKTAGLILQEDEKELFQGASVEFRPDNDQERKDGERHARIYSPREGVVELTAHFPNEERELEAGLINWGVIKYDEARALAPLVDGRRPFLRLVVMDPSIRNTNDLKPFVEATHSDEPDLRPKTLLNSIASIVKGNPLYEVSMYAGIVRVDRYERGKIKQTEEWITIPPVEGKDFLLVGKKVNTKI